MKEENQVIIKAINMYGRVPEQYELLEEIERLKEELEYTIPIVEHNKTITKHLKEIERLNENNQAMQEEMAITWKKLDEKENIINKAIEYIKKEITCYSDLEIDDLIDILQGSE